MLPGLPAPDGQTYASSGCVYPARTQTIFDQCDQFDHAKVWKIYAQDMGNDPKRENVYQCAIPGDPSGAGVVDPGDATPTDQYVAQHNPAAWFHSVFDQRQDCKNVVPLDGYHATPGHTAIPSLSEDLKRVPTTPAFSWITPNNCSDTHDAHDATCVGDNLSRDPTNRQGGLYAADLFLKKWVPQVMDSPAFQNDGEIQILFDEAFPPYTMYGNLIADDKGNSDPSLNVPTDTEQSVVACCDELPGPNTHPTGFPGVRAGHHPGGITTGGADGKGHLGYAGMEGLRTIGKDVYNNHLGHALKPSPSGSSAYPATANENDVPARVVKKARSRHPPSRLPLRSWGNHSFWPGAPRCGSRSSTAPRRWSPPLGPRELAPYTGGATLPTSTPGIITLDLRVTAEHLAVAADDLTSRDQSGRNVPRKAHGTRSADVTAGGKGAIEVQGVYRSGQRRSPGATTGTCSVHGCSP